MTRIVGKSLRYNAAAQLKYYRQISSLVDKANEIVTNDLSAFYSQPFVESYFSQDDSVSSQARILMNAIAKKVEKLFSDGSLVYGRAAVKNQDRISRNAMKASLKRFESKIALSSAVLYSKNVEESLKASVTQNVNLIRSIATRYLPQIESALMRSITTQQGMPVLYQELVKQKQISKRHAKMVAYDQTRKVYNCLNRDRMISAGITKYTWRHSGGGQHPRELHIQMDGVVYDFDDPPVIDRRTGERGIPAQAIKCKCYMTPVIVFGE